MSDSPQYYPSHATEPGKWFAAPDGVQVIPSEWLDDTAEALACERRERVFGVAVLLVQAVAAAGVTGVDSLTPDRIDKLGATAERIVSRLWDREPTPPTRPDVAEVCCCEQEQAEQLAGDAA